MKNGNGLNGNALTIELEKSKAHIIVEIVEYVPNAVVCKTIIKKTTGNVSASSLDAGEELTEKTSPFDIDVQIIDGTAEVSINDKVYKLNLGEGIVIPAIQPIVFMLLMFNSNDLYNYQKRIRRLITCYLETVNYITITHNPVMIISFY